MTIVLISAATLTVLVPRGVALGSMVGGMAGGSAAWIGFKGLKNNNSYKVVTTALDAWFNRLRELEEGAFRISGLEGDPARHVDPAEQPGGIGTVVDVILVDVALAAGAGASVRCGTLGQDGPKCAPGGDCVGGPGRA